MKIVEPHRPRRDDETPVCTFHPDLRLPNTSSQETPLVTYYVEDRAPPNEARLLLRVERTGPRRRDETPSYVFTCETFPPRAGDEEDASQIRFGDWLIRRGLISRVELFQALERAKRARCRVGDALVELRALDRDQVEEEAVAHGAFAGFQRGAPLGLPHEA